MGKGEGSRGQLQPADNESRQGKSYWALIELSEAQDIRGWTYQHIGDELGLTRERARQLLHKTGVMEYQTRVARFKRRRSKIKVCAICFTQISWQSPICGQHRGRRPGSQYPCCTCKKLTIFPDGFSSKGPNDGGYEYRCKPCCARSTRAWYRANTEYAKVQERRYYATHKADYKRWAKIRADKLKADPVLLELSKAKRRIEYLEIKADPERWATRQQYNRERKDKKRVGAR